MTIYTILALDLGEEQCYRPRGKGKNDRLHVPGNKSPICVHEKHQFAPFSSLSHCEFCPSASYLELELTCQLYLCVLQRQPGVNTDKDSQEEEDQRRNINFPTRLDTCAMLILTPARCQH